MSSVENHIELSFGSDVRLLDLVQCVSDNLASMLGFDSDAQYWIGLSVREAVTNAIQHGNSSDLSKEVKLGFYLSEEALKIVVQDQGTGIDESEIPDPLDPENLLKAGGRGIFFVRSFMDSVDFRLRPDGGHEIIMEKSRHKQGEKNDN